MPFDASVLAVKLTRREQDALRGKLARMRADELTSHLCTITRAAMRDGRIVTPLSLEGLFRHVVRAALCLQGWRWRDADDAACNILGVVFAILQVKRPSWYEGQAEYTIERGSLIERTRCANCHKPLEGEQMKFCERRCANTYNKRLNWLREANEGQVARALGSYQL